MCGRYALAGDADELPLEFWRQYNPDYQPSAEDDPASGSTTDDQDSADQRPEEVQASESEGGEGFRMASELPSDSVGGLRAVGSGGAGLGRSGDGDGDGDQGGGGGGAPEQARGLPIGWASDEAKRVYRKRYNVSQVISPRHIVTPWLI